MKLRSKDLKLRRFSHQVKGKFKACQVWARFRRPMTKFPSKPCKVVPLRRPKANLKGNRVDLLIVSECRWKFKELAEQLLTLFN